MTTLGLKQLTESNYHNKEAIKRIEELYSELLEEKERTIKLLMAARD